MRTICHSYQHVLKNTFQILRRKSFDNKMFISFKTETRPIQSRAQTRNEMTVQGTDKPRVYKHLMEDYTRQLETSTKLSLRSIQTFCPVLLNQDLSQRPQSSLPLKEPEENLLKPIKLITPSKLWLMCPNLTPERAGFSECVMGYVEEALRR